MKTCPHCQQTYADTNAFCPRDGSALALVQGLTPGTLFRRKFRIIAELGRGGMGVVYRAQHIFLKEERALKLINARYSEDPQAVRRFLAEAMMANQINHPNVAAIYDADETDDGQPYVVMEYVPGVSLRQILRSDDSGDQKPLEPLRAIGIAMQVCAGLSTAHAKHIIHRDIKPDNILIVPGIDGNDIVKVVDFGIAKAKKELHGMTGTTHSLSQSGIFIGTPQYSSPEQARGVKGDLLDQRVDIYSLGIVLYEMLVGQVPFNGDIEDVLQHQKHTPPPLPNAMRPDLDIPEPIVSVTMKALNKDIASRFTTADEMRRALENARETILRPPEPVTIIPTVKASRPTIASKAQTPPDRLQAPVPDFKLQVIDAQKPRFSLKPLLVGLIAVIVLSISGYVVFGPAKTNTPTGEPNRQQQQQSLDPTSRGTETAKVPDAPKRTEKPSSEALADIPEKIREAQAAKEEGKYDNAIQLLQEVLRRDPSNVIATRALNDAQSAKALEERILGKKQ